MLNLPTMREMSSLYLEKSCDDDLTDVGESIRDWFSKTDFERIYPYPRHTHGESAATRSVGSNFIEIVSGLAGGQPFYVQGSAADVRRGREVSRAWHWAKDLGMAVQVMPPPSTDALKISAMVDVDEYIDMPDYLACRFQPHLIYTFVPSAAAKDKGEYSYRFLSDGKVEYVVSGGGKYVHHVWDYSHDSLKVTGGEWIWMESGSIVPVYVMYTAFYKVERRNVDADHQVVLLAPTRRWHQILPFGNAYLADKMIDGPPLVRLNPVIGNFVRLQIKTPDDLVISTARVGDFSCSRVSKRVDEEVAIKASLVKDKLSVAMVKSTMANNSHADEFGAEVMTAYHRDVKKPGDSLVFDTKHGVRSYQFLPKLADYDPDAQASMRSFMPPLVDGGFAPDMSKSNDKRSVKKRIEEVRTQTVVTPKLDKAIRAFVSFIADEVLVPVDEEEVYERQNRPTQRAILERANYESLPGVASSFMKRQAETNVGDPRMITQIDGSDKKAYSQLIYAVAEKLKKLSWYISGMKPREVAERVASIASLLEALAETDFSRMDGRISEVARHLETVLMHALFSPKLHARIDELMRRQTWLRCATRFGVRYNSQFARGSGSPETSAFNTILTAFVIFLAFTLDGYSFEEAWKKLCDGAACCGDDAVSAGLREHLATKAAKMVGQKLSINMRRVGDTVSFLARHYGPDVWFGDTDSCCDLKRQLSKFHLATYVEHDSQARLLKLREKSFAYYLTDEHTPVLGPFVKKVLSLAPVQHGTGSGLEYKNILHIWNSDIEKSDQYPSSESGIGWKRELCEQQLPDLCIDIFESWVQSCTTLEMLMDPPAPTVIEAKHPGGEEVVVVDGDVLHAPKTDGKKRTRGRRGGAAVRRTERGKTPSVDRTSRQRSGRPTTKDGGK